MKTQPLTLFLFIFFIASASCLAQETGYQKKWTYTTGNNLQEILISTEDGETKRCKLNSEASRVILSFNRSTLIVSENGYVKTKELQNCDAQREISVKFIPEKNGLLVDFNSQASIYISLIFVAVQPLSYVAYIGKLGANKNLVSLPGAFDTRKQIGRMQQEAFVYSDELIFRPKISVSGRYVTPDGDVDCSLESFPGVWDIYKDKKVIISQKQSLTTECDALFNE